MSPMTADLLYGLCMACSGAGAAWWLLRRPTRVAVSTGPATMQHAAVVLARLEELAMRVALDVDDHSGQVEAINEQLKASRREPTAIVDAVNHLIESNQQMQEKLALTENKLRDQARQLEAQTTEARTDALTLLANRRAFDEDLARRFAEFQRQHRPFSVVLIDIDYFKQFNDSYGHLAGDQVLRGVAKVLRRKAREMDLLARFGGEEFAIILPGTSVDAARQVAARYCATIAESRFSLESQVLQVTVSVGVGEIQAGEDAAGLLERVDRALYASKHAGRDCTHWHDGQSVHRVGAPDRAVEATDQSLKNAVGKEPSAGESSKQDRPRLPAVSDDRPLQAASCLPNRMIFCQQIRSRLAEWKRGGPIISLILIEVNLQGSDGSTGRVRKQESMQRAATRLLTASVRDMDQLGQYGPSCFGLLLPAANLLVAAQVAERLREGMTQVCLAKSEKSEETRSMTVNSGVVQAQEGDDWVALVKRAEAALEEADRRGGNRGYYHDGQQCAPITALLEPSDLLT